MRREGAWKVNQEPCMGQRTIRALLIEDNAADARLVRELLTASVVPFEIHRADRLATAIEDSGPEDPDIVLVDLSLPDSGGYDTFVAAHRRWACCPVIVLSG